MNGYVRWGNERHRDTERDIDRDRKRDIHTDTQRDRETEWFELVHRVNGLISAE